ncbi:MAG: ATP-binding protein [Planctomycetota bacterium]|nr:ATP-binding protein [Planctomycetota bacterium]
MLRSRFLWKLYAGYVILILATAVCTVAFTADRAHARGMHDLETRLANSTVFLSEFARPYLLADNRGALQDPIERLGASLDVRLTIIANDGTVIADSTHNPATMDNHGDRPELITARDQGTGRSTRFSTTLREDMLYQARLLHYEGQTLGWARAAMPTTQVASALSNHRDSALIAGLITALLALPLGLVFARRVTTPLVRMTEVATAMADGDLTQRVTPNRHDEIGQLAEALNTMAAQLAERVTTIESERNQLQAVLTGMEEGLIAIDANERITLINQPARKLIGIGDAPARGERFWELCRIEAVNHVLAEAKRSGNTCRLEHEITGRGLDQHVQLLATPIRDTDGHILGVVLVLHDITELRRLETVRRDFVANISHELKTPLTAIRGMVETVLDDPDMPPTLQERFLGRALTQSARLADLVADLLTLSRIEATADAMEREPVSLPAVVSLSLDHLRESANAKQITITTTTVDSTVLGDAESLRQITDNLIDNAIKYTPDGGTVSIELSVTEHHAILRISDTGIGIGPADRARVFERFYRVDKARSREIGSTGLGLAIVKHLVLAHQGHIELESTPGTGSTFQVRLPLAPSDHDTGEPTAE